jgi:hypothetical protein
MLAVPEILKAREAARRSTCKSTLLVASHACHGDVVQLDQEGGIESVSPSRCPICSRTGRCHTWIRFIDSNGRELNDKDVPPETRRVAVERLTRQCRMALRHGFFLPAGHISVRHPCRIALPVGERARTMPCTAV